MVSQQSSPNIDKRKNIVNLKFQGIHIPYQAGHENTVERPIINSYEYELSATVIQEIN